MVTAPASRRGPRQWLGSRAATLAGNLATPLLPRDYIDLIAPLSSSALRGRIESVHAETSDAATLTIRPGRGWRGHEPGQYVRLGVDVDGVRLWRAYSVTSRVDHHGRFTVTVKAIPDGVVSNHLVRNVRPGAIVQLDQATGAFTLPPAPPAKVLFITAGSGITPVMGMLRNRLDALTDAVHVHAAPTRDDVIFGDELRQLSGTGRLRLVESHDDSHGFLTAERLQTMVGDLAERETWACGPVGLLDALEDLYAELGIPDRLHTERFRPSITAAGEGGTVEFASHPQPITAGPGTTILDAGEAAGVLMPSGCRMGICFGCVLPLTEGAVRDLRTGEITTATPGDNVQIQTCISAAAGACHIDL